MPEQLIAREPAPGRPRIVTSRDVATVTELLVDAFYDDPLWGPWAFPDADRRRDQQRVMWQFFVEGAVRYPWSWLTADGSATSVWIPPGGSEVEPDRADELEPMLRDLLGPGADRVLQIFSMFDRAHPHDRPPHYHLSLLATDPRRRGRGQGLGLLADNLSLIDELQAPAYLEASNLANVALYARYGFEPLQTLHAPGGGPDAVTMWREARVS